MSIGLSFLAFMLLVGLWTLVSAVSFAIRPGERKLSVFRALSICTTMAILSGTATALALALGAAADGSGGASDPAVAPRLLAGLAESMVTAVLGFSVLAVSWLVVAVGLRRQA